MTSDNDVHVVKKSKTEGNQFFFSSFPSLPLSLPYVLPAKKNGKIAFVTVPYDVDIPKLH